MVSDKIKALLSMRGKKYKELAGLFGISEQAMRNKFARGSFSADELIMIADFVECQLAFELDDTQKIFLTLADLRSPASERPASASPAATPAPTESPEQETKPEPTGAEQETKPEPTTPKKKRKVYAPLTPEAAAKIDLKRLP